MQRAGAGAGMQGIATASSLIHVIALEAPQFIVARRRLNQQVRHLDLSGIVPFCPPTASCLPQFRRNLSSRITDTTPTHILSGAALCCIALGRMGSERHGRVWCEDVCRDEGGAVQPTRKRLRHRDDWCRRVRSHLFKLCPIQTHYISFTRSH